MIFVIIIAILSLIGICFLIYVLKKDEKICDKKKRIRNQILNRINKKTGESFFNSNGNSKYVIDFELIKKKKYNKITGELEGLIEFPILKIRKIYDTEDSYVIEWTRKYTKEGEEIPECGEYLGMEWKNI